MHFKSLINLFLTGVISLTVITACNTDEPSTNRDYTHNDDVLASSISLSKTKISIKVDETESLKATVLPNNTTNKNITWNTSDASIATVTDGTVKGISEGTAVVTATCGDVMATCTVEVLPKPDNYRCVFGYLYSKDLLMFLTPKITIDLDGKEPMVYTLNQGNNTPTEDGIKYNNISISSGPSGATYWWIGKEFDSKQSGTVTISYEKTDIDYSEYDNLTNLPFNFWSRPFVSQAKVGSTSINHYTWISINLGTGDTLSKIIENIINSTSNTCKF